MTLAGSTADRAMASRADGEPPSMARRNRAEVVVADEIGVYHCVQRVVRRAFLCGVDPLSGNSYDHRRNWIRDRLESLAGLFGVEIAAFAVLSNHVHVILRSRPDKVCRCLPEKNTGPSRRRQPWKTRGDLRPRCRRAAMAG